VKVHFHKTKRKTQLKVIMMTSMGGIEQAIQEPKMNRNVKTKEQNLRTRIGKPNWNKHSRNGIMEEIMKEELRNVKLWWNTPLDGMESPRWVHGGRHLRAHFSPFKTNLGGGSLIHNTQKLCRISLLYFQLMDTWGRPPYL